MTFPSVPEIAARLLLALLLGLVGGQCVSSHRAPATRVRLSAEELTHSIIRVGKDVYEIESVAPDATWCIAIKLEAVPGKAPAVDWTKFTGRSFEEWKAFITATNDCLFAPYYSGDAWERYAFSAVLLNLETNAMTRLPMPENDLWLPMRNRREIAWSKEEQGTVYGVVTFGTHYDTTLALLLTCKAHGCSVKDVLAPLEGLATAKAERQGLGRLPCGFVNFEGFDLSRGVARFTAERWDPQSKDADDSRPEVKCTVNLKTGQVQGPQRD